MFDVKELFGLEQNMFFCINISVLFISEEICTKNRAAYPCQDLLPPVPSIENNP